MADQESRFSMLRLDSSLVFLVILEVSLIYAGDSKVTSSEWNINKQPAKKK